MRGRIAIAVVAGLCGVMACGKAMAQASSPSSAPAAPQGNAAQKPQRYANMPDEAVPFAKFSKPYKEWFIDEDTLDYYGAARERVVPEMLTSPTVNIGFLGPIESGPEKPYGVAMLHGAQLAIDEANAAGGFHGGAGVGDKAYSLVIHNDSPLWGASSVEPVKMIFDEHVVAVLGSIDGASTHIMLRVSLKLEVPIMDTGTTDPTVTETRIPWIMHDFTDDRQQGYALAGYIFKDLKLKRIGVIRTQTRYARVGVAKFFDEAKRMGHVPVLEVKFDRGDQDFSMQLRMLKNAHLDAVVIWGEAADAGLIVKQMREAGMQQPIFGSSRVAYPELLEIAGKSAEGMVTTAPLDLSRGDARWLDFQQRYRAKFGSDPDAYATYAYDGMNVLIESIQKAGLNRGLVMDELRTYRYKTYDGVAGTAHFDATLNNITPPGLARVENGKFVYWNPAKDGSNEAGKNGGAM